MACQLAALFTRQPAPVDGHRRAAAGRAGFFAWHGLCKKDREPHSPHAFHGAAMHPDLPPPLPLSPHHGVAMEPPCALPPAPPQPPRTPRTVASALSIAEARLRSILMGV